MPSTVDSPLEAAEPILERLQGVGNNEEFLATIKHAIRVAAFTEFSPQCGCGPCHPRGDNASICEELDKWSIMSPDC